MLEGLSFSQPGLSRNLGLHGHSLRNRLSVIFKGFNYYSNLKRWFIK